MSQPDLEDSDPLLGFSSECVADDHASQVTRAPEPTAQTIAARVDPAPPPVPTIPIDVLMTRIERLETALDDSKVQVSTLKVEVATLVRALADIKGTVGTLNGTVGDVKSTVGALNGTVGNVKSTVGVLNSAVGVLSSRIGAVDSAVGDVKGTVGALTSSMGDVRGTVSDVKSSLGDLTSRVGALNSTVADVKSRVGELKKQIARPESITTAMGLPRPARAVRPASATLAAVIGLSAAVFGWVFTGDAGARLEAVPRPQPQAQPVQEAAFVPADQPVAPPESRASVPTAAPVPVSVPVASRATAEDKHVNYVGTLSVDAEPGGEVFVDRQSVGPTPLKLTNLRAGSHLIWVERDGYRRWTRVVQVPADRVTRLVADLEPVSPR